MPTATSSRTMNIATRPKLSAANSRTRLSTSPRVAGSRRRALISRRRWSPGAGADAGGAASARAQPTPPVRPAGSTARGRPGVARPAAPRPPGCGGRPASRSSGGSRRRLRHPRPAGITAEPSCITRTGIRGACVRRRRSSSARPVVWSSGSVGIRLEISTAGTSARLRYWRTRPMPPSERWKMWTRREQSSQDGLDPLERA